MGDISVRVSDAERRVVDDRLMAAVGDGVLTLAEYDERAGQVWQARTRGDLDALVADLPAQAALRPPAPPAVPPAAPRRVVAVLSEDRLHGAVVPGQEVRGYGVLGKAVLDLRRQDLPDGVRVRVRAVLGEVEVQLPAGSRVELSGATVLGDRKVAVPPGDGPLVHLDAVAVLGAVQVTVGDGTVVPAGSAVPALPDPRTATAAPVPGPAQRPLGRRLAARVRKAGVAGVLALLAVGVVASGTDQRVVFGSSEERVRPDRESASVSVLFGSVQVVVPDDAEVDTSGLVVFGSTECDLACDGDGTGQVVEVRSFGAFGSVEILTQSEKDAEQAD